MQAVRSIPKYGTSKIDAIFTSPDVVEEENPTAHTEQLGQRLKEQFHGLRKQVPWSSDIRGLSATVAVEFAKPGIGAADMEFAKRVQARALEKGLLLFICGVYSNVIRFLFPLTISDEVMVEALTILEAAMLEG